MAQKGMTLQEMHRRLQISTLSKASAKVPGSRFLEETMTVLFRGTRGYLQTEVRSFSHVTNKARSHSETPRIYVRRPRIEA